MNIKKELEKQFKDFKYIDMLIELAEKNEEHERRIEEIKQKINNNNNIIKEILRLRYDLCNHMFVKDGEHIYCAKCGVGNVPGNINNIIEQAQLEYMIKNGSNINTDIDISKSEGMELFQEIQQNHPYLCEEALNIEFKKQAALRSEELSLKRHNNFWADIEEPF